MATIPAVKTPKTAKVQVPVAAKVTETLTRAILTKKITADELKMLSDHITKLQTILS